MMKSDSGLVVPNHLKDALSHPPDAVDAKGMPIDKPEEPEKLDRLKKKESKGMKEDTEEEAGRFAKQVPHPKGFSILIMLPEISEYSAGGILIGDEEVRAQQTASICGYVMDMGDVCYANEAKFPTGPWCKKGDWVMFQAYSGTRFSIHGREFRLIFDTSIQAVVDDPRGVSKLL